MRDIIVGLIHYILFLFIAVVISSVMPLFPEEAFATKMVWLCRVIAFWMGCYSTYYMIDLTWRIQSGWNETRALLALLGTLMCAIQAYFLIA